MPIIEINAETWLKSSTAQSSTLTPGAQKVKLLAGKKLSVTSIVMDVGNHAKVTFAPPLEVVLGGTKHVWPTGYIFGPHINGISAYQKAIALSSGPATGKNDRYFLHANAASLQQCNNKDWGDDNLRYGAVQCGLTSCAQLLTAVFPWEKVRKLATEAGGQFEDWVAGQFMRLGEASTSMEGHVAVLRALGVPCNAYRNWSVAQLKEQLRFTPVVLGMAYKSSGHFVTAVGYCDNPPATITQKSPVGSIGNLVASNTKITTSGIIYNDPYGDRDWSGSANNWHEITDTMDNPAGLHCFCSDADMSVFWAEPDAPSSGWCVVPDRSVKLLGGPAASPSVISIAQPISTNNSTNTSGPRRFKPQEFRSNSIAVDIISHFEGLELSQYYCSAGVSTIGLGTTRWHNGESIPVGASITKEQAVAFFKRDSTEFIASIAKDVDVPLTARQIAALLSFAYNCGSGGFSESSLRRSINESESFDAIRTNFRKWAKAGGDVLPGLLRRRNAEAILWSGSDGWAEAGYD